MVNNNSITTYLIKSEYVKFSDIIRDDITSLSSFDINNLGSVFFVNSQDNPPSWISSFFHNDGMLRDKIFNSSSKAILLVRIYIGQECRIFALAFGRGGSLLHDYVIEERFGLKTVLNLIGEKNLRNISKTVIGGNQKNTTEQMPRQSSIDEFEIDIDTDLINKVTGKVEEGKLITGTVTGSDSLLVKHPVDITNVKSFLESIYLIYLNKDYLSSFEWIDRVMLVKDKVLISELDKGIIDQIQHESNVFWMAVPEIIDWERCNGFKISGDKNNTYDDIYIDKVIQSVREPLTSIEQLKNKRVDLVDLNDQVITSWSAYKCIYGELRCSDRSYCINNGKWYEIDIDYSKSIENKYFQTNECSINFSEYHTGMSEEKYNQLFAGSSANKYLCLDRRLVRLGNQHNPIEICDLLSKDNQLIHIKKYAGSSVLSHLFNQGFVSATLLKKNDSSFVTQANEKIAELTTESEYLFTSSKEYEIVFGIISTETDSIPNIPFFSKISFCNIRDKLSLYGYKCSIKSIKKVS